MLYAYMPSVALKRRTESSGPGDYYWCYQGHAQRHRLNRGWGWSMSTL